jgi:hypothetical protein
MAPLAQPDPLALLEQPVPLARKALPELMD